MPSLTASHSSNTRSDDGSQQIPTHAQAPYNNTCYNTHGDAKLTWMQKPHLQSTFQGAEQLLPLISPFQAELEVLHCRLRLWEIYKPSSDYEQWPCSFGRQEEAAWHIRGQIYHSSDPSPRVNTEWVSPTSNNAEELFNAHAGVDAVEEPLDVAPPALQGAAGF